MERFTDKSLRLYLTEKVFKKLNFSNPAIENIEEVSGGLSSAVFRVKIRGITFYVKQVIKGALANAGNLPEDLLVLFSMDRQKYERKAIELFNDAIGEGYAPDIIYHNLKDRVLILSEVCGENGKLFESIFEETVNETITRTLAKVSADLANKTFGKYKFLRSKSKDLEIKKVKLKYIFAPFLSNAEIPYLNKALKKFFKESINCNKSLSHGDYHPKNIIIGGNNKIGLIDFEESIVHDPVVDISALLADYMLFSLKYSKSEKRIKNLGILLIDEFFKHLKIPEKKSELEYSWNTE